MIRINLLPHRELKKAAHRKRFQNMLAAALLTGLGLSYAGYSWLDSTLSEQQRRNQQLEQAIAQLDQQLSNIENLRQQRMALLSRKELVEQLQNSRTEATRIFDHLIKTLPEGVFIKSFKQTGTTIALSGTSLSSARVSALMRNLEQSEVFSAPILIEVSSTLVDNVRANDFSLSLSLRTPATSASQPVQAVPGATP
ncbi:PilN domain-containing protein [Vogesella indigofera]|uniref:PilN domain-containing protein n=1 Tax=Vogesella indigofera TaxID=45465 RepID=A0A495BLW9_VOGIN|nr:PilN domain-containing protein [Vogesella indigofera]MDC7691896.1 PilN domain-containing protein [Vogesella indigofera]RKQ62189.1 type IV pilus assembly protein PilN [Vogesella indigofera]